MGERLLLLATRNPGKIREIRHELSGLGVWVRAVDDWPGATGIPEPVEYGAAFAENARDKALYYARATGQWCLADDSGLVVDALSGRPGVHSARYAIDRCAADAGRAALDTANNAKLLEELGGVADKDRTARFVCCLALADERQVLLEAKGVIEGRIGYEPRGETGFGYDPLFFVPGLGCTTAQLPVDEKNRISHRGQAIRAFVEQLREMLKGGGDERG